MDIRVQGVSVGGFGVDVEGEDEAKSRFIFFEDLSESEKAKLSPILSSFYKVYSSLEKFIREKDERLINC